jgi:uncharacterized membrane protein
MSRKRQLPNRRRQRQTTRQATAARAAPAAERVVLTLAAIGVLITAYLTAVAFWGERAAFCAPDSGCDVVQGSRWSVVLGMPVTLWGLGLYALIAALAWRMRAGVKRWRRLWHLTLIGTAISTYLTITGIVALDAVCGWCLASQATMTAMFVWIVWNRPDTAPGMAWPQWLAHSGVIMIAAVAVLHIYYSGLLERREHPRLQALATHLEATGARYYGAYWCGSCQEQRRHFGASADRLPYVECTPAGRGGPTASACAVADISSFPTWVIDGQRMEGVLTPQELARYSGFDWNNASGN